VPSRTLYSVNLALDELVTNVILYGYEEGSEKEIAVKLETTKDGLVASVADEAKPFNPLNVAAPDLKAPLEERQLGGLGIHLVRSLMDHVSYKREKGKNVLTIRKRIR